MSNKKWHVLVGSVVLACSASMSAQAADQMKPAPDEPAVSHSRQSAHAAATASDREMMNKLAQANMAEVALAELAKTKSTDEKILKFADAMIEDHTQAQKDLASVADQAEVKLPKQTDAKHAQLLKKMQTMDHDAFDRAYKSQAVKDHAAAQKLLKHIVANAKHDDFKALAKKLTPAIDKHMQMAKAL